MIPKAPTNRSELARLLKQGEGRTLEFKRSTGELREGMQTVCAFLNGSGGTVLFGVRPDGHPEGPQVSDQTLRDIAQALDKFEPPVNLPVYRLPVAEGKVILILRVDGTPDSVPITFEGRPYERVSSTTRKMSQDRYERLLLDRGHARRRWENQPAVDVRMRDLDREEILRTCEAAIEQRRISAGTSRNIGDILDRLGLRRDGVITQAAQVLYGTRFLPDYPQCVLKMGRFRGTKITGDILDNKQEHMHAFAMVREGMAFLDRTLPLSARFPEGKIFREDRLPVPPNALREILLNAVMHRDYSDAGGHVAIAVFDDRIEIRSTGRLPSGVTIEQLSGPHRSELRDPLIAGAFHRTGAVAHKMGRRWIMAELGEHCHTYMIPRLKKVIGGADPGGVTKAADWKGGGGFRYSRLAPSLLQKDQFGNWVINRKYNAAMLAEAICKLEGFAYAPSDAAYWQHGRSTEKDFIYVTTQTLARDQIQKLSDEVGEGRSLLILCGAFRLKNLDAFPNLTVKKIPKAVLSRCEWGKDDYSLEIRSLPIRQPEEKEMTDDGKPRTKEDRRAAVQQRSLFDLPAAKGGAK